jgi:hypothetical protein
MIAVEARVMTAAEVRVMTAVEARVMTVAEARVMTVVEVRVMIVAEARVMTVVEVRVMIVAEARVMTVVEVRVMTVVEVRVMIVAEVRVMIAVEERRAETVVLIGGHRAHTRADLIVVPRSQVMSVSPFPMNRRHCADVRVVAHGAKAEASRVDAVAGAQRKVGGEHRVDADRAVPDLVAQPLNERSVKCVGPRPTFRTHSCIERILTRRSQRSERCAADETNPPVERSKASRIQVHFGSHYLGI